MYWCVRALLKKPSIFFRSRMICKEVSIEGAVLFELMKTKLYSPVLGDITFHRLCMVEKKYGRLSNQCHNHDSGTLDNVPVKSTPIYLVIRGNLSSLHKYRATGGPGLE